MSKREIIIDAVLILIGLPVFIYSLALLALAFG